MLYARFLQPRNHQGQSSAIPSWELIKPKIILETKRVCWCHTICQRQKARSKETAAEVPPRGSQQHSEFPRASAETPPHCAAGLPALAPLSSLAGFSPVSTLYLPLFSFPPHANPTPFFHLLLTESRFYRFPLTPLQNGQCLLPSDLSFCRALNLLPFQGLPHQWASLCGENRFYPAGLVLNMGTPCWQPIGSSIYNIYNTSWYNDTH